jgi:uncharacterized membrane protein YhaH (DUF805 family)
MESFNPFVFQGRLGRMQYFGYGIIWGVILLVIAFISGESRGAVGLYIVAMIVFAIATLSYGIRRLHDFDKSGWWYLLMFIPYVNVVFGLVLLFAPGTQGSNSYGVRTS